MGNLTPYLQEEFERLCPDGWRCRREHSFLTRDLSRLLGFSPRVDVCLEKLDGSRRLWVEFEISRADPAANHVKFATAHLFQPFEETDAFVSMVSAHVAPGRRNLGSQAVIVMRRLGLRAHQTPLLPAVDGQDIKRINHLTHDLIGRENLVIGPELDRLFAVADPVLEVEDGALHFAGNPMEVRLNLHRWNREMTTDAARAMWGRRTIKYFVYDPLLKLFAPSKFCAYTMLRKSDNLKKDPIWPGGMNMSIYTRIDQACRIFDGQRAWKHLVDRLGMKSATGNNHMQLMRNFENWVGRFRDSVTIHPKGPAFILLS